LLHFKIFEICNRQKMFVSFNKNKLDNTSNVKLFKKYKEKTTLIK